MEKITTTPFGRRPVTAGLIARAEANQEPAQVPHADKWALLRALCTARREFGVTDRDLTVLSALLSFHPDTNLSDNAGLVVFPSNAALSNRTHGMAESTLRRHLAALVQNGLIERHDSPNGKRYARRGQDGEIARAFGFDLRPLLRQATKISRSAEEARAVQARLDLAREKVSLMKRDALKLALYGQENGFVADWPAIEADLLGVHKAMRRKLSIEEVLELDARLGDILEEIRGALTSETEETNGNDADIGRHYHNSNPDTYESEPSQEMRRGEPRGSEHLPAQVEAEMPRVPLPLVLKACPDILPYCDTPPRCWHELVVVASHVRGMMGISHSAWDEAQRDMGAETAAVTVACILQRFDAINSPGGYLRALSVKASSGAFSPGPMLMALLNTPNHRAA